MDSTVLPLLKVWDAAYRSGDWPDYSRAWKELKMGIQITKYRCKQHTEEHFDNSPWNMWRGIRTVMDYKCSATIPLFLTPSTVSLHTLRHLAAETLYIFPSWRSSISLQLHKMFHPEED